MSEYEQMTDAPLPVEYEANGSLTTVLLRTEIEQHTEGEGEGALTYWSAQLTRIVVQTDVLTPELRKQIEADPAKYVQMVEVDGRKDGVRDAVQAWLDKALETKAVIPCEGFGSGIVYDRQACINALGLEPGDMFIDAADNAQVITEQQLNAVKQSIKKHALSLYGKATMWRGRIDAATTTAELEAIIKELETM